MGPDDLDKKITELEDRKQKYIVDGEQRLKDEELAGFEKKRTHKDEQEGEDDRGKGGYYGDRRGYKGKRD